MQPLAHGYRERRVVFPPEDEGRSLNAYGFPADIHAEELPQRLDEGHRPGPQGIRAEHRQERQRQARESPHHTPCLRRERRSSGRAAASTSTRRSTRSGNRAAA